MIIKITKQKISELFGYGRYSFSQSWTSKERRLRFEWLRTGAILEQNGINYAEALNMAYDVVSLREEKKELEDAINEYADKMEQLKEIRR